MKKVLKQAIAMLGICVCLTGCGEDAKTKNDEKELTAGEAAPGDTARSEAADFFPESYSAQTGKVKFDCRLDVPEEFDALHFPVPAIKGVSCADSEAAYAAYVEGNVISEEYHDEPMAENEKGSDTYILEDGTVVGFPNGGGFVYYKPESTIYRQAPRASERNAPKDNFAFASGDECTEQVKEALKAIGCPIEEYGFGWFSTSGEEYAELERQAVDNGLLDGQNVKTDGWTERDDAYEIYGWQLYEGLPVFPQWMTSAMTRAFESYQKAPVSALYTEQGMLNLSLTEPPYVFEPSQESSKLLTFPEIADVLVQKYDDLLEDASYTGTYAKLVLRACFNEKQELEAEPVWYFEVTDGGSSEVVLVHAVTGEEIFLN